MPGHHRRINRGPAAAAENRAALLAAARELFAERGYDVPMHTIAKHAGVGQGVLYRHFPKRLDLALAVFEENFVRLEEVGAVVTPGSFWALWEVLVDEVVESAAFVEMAVEARRELPDFGGNERLLALFAPHVAAAVAAEEVRPDLEGADVLTGVRMVYGLVVTSGGRSTLMATLAQVSRRWFGPSPG
ncbi:TetR/AcrR family transcriptional regulator [Tessaracoccus sp. G1721]